MAQSVCSYTWNIGLPVQSTYQITNSSLATCDPFGAGLYSGPNGETTSQTAGDGSVLTPNTSTLGFDFTPSATTALTSWTFTVYQVLGDAVTLTINRPQLGTPTISTISPSSGTANGGKSVVINGTGFVTGATVTFGGTAAASVTVDTQTQITATTPARATGLVNVAVGTPGGTATATNAYTFTPPPTVTGISPSQGGVAGGTSVAISGSGFAGATAVRFGGNNATSINVISDTSMTAVSPAGSAGAVDVTVVTPNGTTATSPADLFTYLNLPSVTGVSPSQGPTAAGTIVSISGSNFVAGSTTVSFGGTPATSVTVNSTTSMTAVAPSGTAGTVDITVTTPVGTSSVSGSDQYTFVAAPTISSLSPASGPATGGTAVMISGSGFTASTTVTFGGTAATGVILNSPASITVTTPAHAAGNVDVVVTTIGGSATQVSAFNYVAAPTVAAVSPSSGPTGGGTSVTITGTNFNSATQVTFGGAPAGFSVISATSITATSPSGVGTVDIRVTTQGGTSATSAADQFTYLAPPTVTSLSPTTGPSGGGTSVTITGTGFTGATAVTFGGSTSTFIVNSATSITATSPAGTGTVDVRVTTGGGSSALNAADQFTYIAAPTVTGLSPNSGSTAGGNAVVITGSGFVGATGVKFGATTASFVVGGPTSITATAPAGAVGVVDVIVTTPGGMSATVAADRYTYVAPPVAAAVALTVPFNSATTPVPIDTSNGVTAVAVATNASNGTALAGPGATLTYKPNAGFSGIDSFTYTMTNAAGTSTPGTVTVAVLPSTFAYTPSAPAAGVVGVAYSTTSLATASGGTAPYTYSIVAGALPIGLTLDTNGTLHGTPTSQGPATFRVKVTDTLTAGGPYSITGTDITMNVGAPTISFNVSSLPDGTAGVTYSQTIQASGGSTPYVYVLTGTLPTGLTWNAATGTISGTPTQTSVGASLSVQATDNNHFSATLPLTLRIAAPALSIPATSLPAAALGAAYSQLITGTGGNGPYTYTVTGLPNGMTFASGSSGVTISGAPTAAGSFTAVIKMTDSTSGVGAPFSVTKTFTLIVNTSTMTIGPATLPTPVAGQSYSQTVTAGSGVAPYRYAVTTGALPAGLTIDTASGVVSGTPTSTGVSAFTITATDSSTGPGTPLTASQSYNVNITGQVASAPPVQTQTLSSAPVTFRATANAVGAPFTRVAIATPPPSGTAVVNGEDIVYTPTPSTSGDVVFAYTLTNAIGTSAPISVTVSVRAVPVTAAPLEKTVAANGTADFDITTGATGGPFTGAGVVSISPANAGTATIISTSSAAPATTGNTYTLRFVPAAAFAGTAVIAYTVSNANATSAPGTAKVTVSPRKDPTTDPDVTGLIGAQVEAARRFATTQIGNYNQRLEALHGTGRAPSSNGLSVVLPSSDRGASRDLARCQDIVGITDRDACLRGEVSPTALSKAKSLDVRDKSVGASGVGTGDGAPDLPGEGAGDDKRFAYWTAGSVDFGFANTAAQRSGFKFTTGGVTMGADYRFSDKFSLGAGVGYGHDSTDIGSSGTRSTGDSYSGALYASFRPMPTLFVDAVAGFGSLSFDSRRWVVDANDFANGKRNGTQFFGSLTAGYEYRSDDWLFSPYGRLTASRSTLDQYSESGAGLNALTYFKQNVNTLSGTLGVRAGFAKATRIGTFSPYIRVELQHDFNGQSVAGLAYADIASSGPVYFVPGSPYGSDRVQVGAGTKLRTGVLVFGLDYSVTTGMGGLQQGVRLTFTAPF